MTFWTAAVEGGGILCGSLGSRRWCICLRVGQAKGSRTGKVEVPALEWQLCWTELPSGSREPDWVLTCVLGTLLTWPPDTRAILFQELTRRDEEASLSTEHCVVQSSLSEENMGSGATTLANPSLATHFTRALRPKGCSDHTTLGKG